MSTPPTPDDIGRLALTRREGESLILEHPDFGQIRITIVQSRRGSARIRVTAATDWKITRANCRTKPHPCDPERPTPPDERDPHYTAATPKATRRVVA